MEQLLTQSSFSSKFSHSSENWNQELDFETTFFEVLDHALTMLGDQSKQLLLRYLEQKNCISKNPLLVDFDEFTETLESIFGESAKIIETTIMRCLHEKIPGFLYVSNRSKSFSFADYMNSLRLVYVVQKPNFKSSDGNS